MLRLLRYIAARRLRHERLRTAITLAGIALGVAVVLAIDLANRATLRSVEAMVDEIAGNARLSVRGDEGGFPDSVLALVEGAPGVTAALPVIEGGVRHEESGLSLLLLGVDFLSDSSPRGYEVAAGRNPLELVSRPDRVVITASYAREHRLAVGSPLTLLTARGLVGVQVGGIVKSGELSRAFGGRIVLADLPAAQFLCRRVGRLDRIDLVTGPGFDAALLTRRLPGALRVEPAQSRAAQAAALLSSFQVNLRMVSTVALFVGMFLVYNTMMIAVVQRRREIGILRALGVGRHRVLALFTLEGFAYGAVGSALGVLLGILLARGALLAITSTLGRTLLVAGAGEVALSWPAVAACTALGLSVSTLAAFLPGREAAALPPAVTLRQVPLTEVRHGRVLWFVVTGLALLAGALLLSRLPARHGVPVFGYCAGFAIVFGFAFFSPAACLAAGRLSRPALSRLAGVEGKLAADNLRRTLARTSLSVSALLTGLSLVICVGTMIHSFKKSIVIWVTNTIRADLLVTSEPGRSARMNIPFDIAFGDTLASVPGVRFVNAFRFVNSRFEGRGVALCSLSLAGWLRENRLVSSSRRLNGPPGPDWAVVSENFASRFHRKVGDTIELESPSGPVRLRVATIFLDYTSDQGAVFLDGATYRSRWGDRLVDTFDIYLQPGTDPTAARLAIERRLGRGRPFLINSNAGLRDEILQNVDNTFAIVYALEAIALAIAILGIVNTLVASTLDRRRELGLLRAIGATRRQIGRLFVLEAAGMGLVGVLLGLGAGWALSLLLVNVIQFQSTGWRFLYFFPWGLAAATSAVTLLAAAAAGYYPARIGARTWGVEALQYE